VRVIVEASIGAELLLIEDWSLGNDWDLELGIRAFERSSCSRRGGFGTRHSEPVLRRAWNLVFENLFGFWSLGFGISSAARGIWGFDRRRPLSLSQLSGARRGERRYSARRFIPSDKSVVENPPLGG